MEWQDRPAKPLLIRSWQLPQKWGTTSTCINMAESLGFIIGEYTIPEDLPVIYITDSNNARTMQRNVMHPKEFTHRKFVRNVKQGIDYSIANHLEYLTSKGPRLDQMSIRARESYKRGEAVCKKWAEQKHVTATNHHIDDNNDISLASWDDDASSIDSISVENTTPQAITKNRFRFDDTMLDCHDRIIVVKVYSHQLNKDFTIRVPGKEPSPNMFAISSNQYADNAADQAMKLFKSYDMSNNDQCLIPLSLQDGHSRSKDALPIKGLRKCFMKNWMTNSSYANSYE
jgi:hypothetical protein